MRKEVSLKQIEANRRNALKSTGPRTDAGRAVSKLNSSKHGLTAADIVITVGSNPEDPAAFEELLDGLTEHYLPVGVLERFFVERAAACIWRLHRAYRAERGQTERGIEQAEWIISNRSVSITVQPPVQLYDSPLGTNKYVTREAFQELREQLDDVKKELEKKETENAEGSPFPPMQRVETVLRYETAMERQLYKAIHQLDRLQGIRRGEAIPPPLNLQIT